MGLPRFMKHTIDLAKLLILFSNPYQRQRSMNWIQKGAVTATVEILEAFSAHFHVAVAVCQTAFDPYKIPLCPFQLESHPFPSELADRR